MIKFEKVGAELQREAETAKRAIQCFEHSCQVCASRGLALDCEDCGVRIAHEIAMAGFNVYPECRKPQLDFRDLPWRIVISC
jgi:hypothetical protein